MNANGNDNDLAAFVTATGPEFGIPGVAVGVWANGREAFACHGVTSVDNPLPVTADTLFELGSITKTYTATALMRLVAEGRVELDAPVRRYVPELVLADEQAAAAVTVRQLLNHTSGLDWALLVDTGDGDDALAAYAAQLAGLKLIAPPGARASYSQAGYNLAGRVIEKVTGLSYERAVAELLLAPLGLAESFFHAGDVLTRRFAVGHNPDDDGNLAVASGWKRWRANNPGGGLMSSVADQIRWARFQLDGDASVLPTETLHQMRVSTVELRGSTLGDAFGICWFLREVDGVRTIGHGGSAHGQFAELLIVPERDFAVVSLTNAGPGGIPFNQTVVRWALEHYLGLVERDPEPLPHEPARAQEVAGQYESDAMILVVEADEVAMRLTVAIKPEIRAAADTEMPPDYPPAAMGLLADDGYIITEGGLTGQRGFFARDERGAVVGLDLAGRAATRIPSA